MNFFEMVKKWTVNDYRTQGIKSEVIIDMLISEFVEEIVAYGLGIDVNEKSKIKLLAKEFPIKLGEKYIKNAKASYLLSDEINKKLYLTELNTNAWNFPGRDDREQLTSLVNAADDGVNRLWDFFFKVLDRHIKRPTEESRKYFYTLHKLIDGIGLLPSMKMSELEKEIQRAFSGYVPTIIYISMPPIDTEEKSYSDGRKLYMVMQVIHLKTLLDSRDDFNKYISEDKTGIWESTREILDEIMIHVKK
ncbi:MAG: hypothetical protein IJ668_06975 [Selenomonadaceae bacterium]|nr:hypothetical protein [Selenomonadaceae bacterium]MBR1580224.1 hypothetical protein [Selenomonadaceae bacterium]